MAVAFFFAPFKRNLSDPTDPRVRRWSAVREFIVTDASVDRATERMADLECLGDYAVCKVNATAAHLTAIAALPGVDRIPLARLDDPTASLTAPQRTAVQNRLTSLGYSAAEINARFPAGWGGPYILADVLRFALSRRLRPRADSQAPNGYVCDGPVEPAAQPEDLDAAVT